jgi:hypothetical protein
MNLETKNILFPLVKNLGFFSGRLKGGSFKQKKSSPAWKNLFSGKEKRKTSGTDTDRKISNPELSLLAVNQVTKHQENPTESQYEKNKKSPPQKKN